MTDQLPGVTVSARAICGIGRTTLGPFGANKLVIESDGTVTVTSSGSVLLEHLDINHPAATSICVAARAIQDRHSDGTSTFMTFTEALLAKAESLVDLGIHPTTIEQGYREAMKLSTEELNHRLRPLSMVGLDAVARTALTGTRDPNVREHIGGSVSQVIERLIDQHDIPKTPKDSTASNKGRAGFNSKNIAVVTRLGGGQSETELVRGVVLDHEPIIDGMPRVLSSVGVCTLSETIDVPHLGSETSQLSMGASFDASSFEEREEIREQEYKSFNEMFDTVLDHGCKFIVTSQSINDRVKTQFVNKDVLALQRLDKDDLVRVSRATGAQIVPGLKEAEDSNTIGTGDISVQRVAGRDMTVVESDIGEPVYTFFCRAPDPRSVEGFRRSVESALAASTLAQQSKNIVPGGGAVEMSIARSVREHARSVANRKGLAIEGFADALETIPQILAENAGLDKRTLIRLGVAHSEERDTVGIDAFAGTISEVLADDPIVEPAELKRDIWHAATNLSIQLLRIDAQLRANNIDNSGIDMKFDDM